MSTWIEIPISATVLTGARINPIAAKGEPHITLSYFDADDEDTLANIVLATRHACSGIVPMRGALTGIGTFYLGSYKQPVVLVNSLAVCELWHRLRFFLKGQGLKPDEQYGFQPHISMDPKVVGSGDAIAGTFRVHQFRMSVVRVCHKRKVDGKKITNHHDIQLEERGTVTGRLSCSERNEANPPTHAKLDLSDTEI